MPDVIEVANTADMIVDGYAFVLREDGISVLNLRHPSPGRAGRSLGLLGRFAVQGRSMAKLRTRAD